jgi:hypothetical protein
VTDQAKVGPVDHDEFSPRHVGLGPGLVDEHQPLGLNPALILCPLRPPTRDAGTLAFASHHGFFEAQLLDVREAPDRSVIHLQTGA